MPEGLEVHPHLWALFQLHRLEQGDHSHVSRVAVGSPAHPNRMNGNSSDALRERALRQGTGPNGFNEVVRHQSSLGLEDSVAPDETLHYLRTWPFYPDDLADFPAIDLDGFDDDAVAQAQYSIGDMDIYVVQADGLRARCLLSTGGKTSTATLNLDGLEAKQEYDIRSSQMRVVERDPYFVPATVGDIKKDVLLSAAFSKMGKAEQDECVQFYNRAADFASAVDSPFASEKDRKDFAWYCASRYMQDRSTAQMSGYALAVGWLTSRR